MFRRRGVRDGKAPSSHDGESGVLPSVARALGGGVPRELPTSAYGHAWAWKRRVSQNFHLTILLYERTICALE